MAAARGALVVLEGIDGAGTTTQARMLAPALERAGRAAHLTREPSDGPVGRLLRQMLAGEHAPVDAGTLALLFAADRADHLQREIEPAIARGQVVVSDRYYHSSLAYQNTGEAATARGEPARLRPGLDEREWIAVLNARARRPDLTVLLDVDPEVAAARRAADNRPEEIFDRVETQKRVARNYLEVVGRLGGSERIIVLEGTRPVEDLHAEILRHVEEALSS